VVAFSPLVGLAAAQGGFFATSWGWASVPLLWAAALAAVLSTRASLSRAEVVFLGALTALTGWIALSAAWSAAPATSLVETERALVYAAAASALLLVSGPRSTRRILGALLLAIAVISAFSLATRVFPDRIGVTTESGGRLAQPIGYWNGLALFVAVGILLALGFAARGRTLVVRSLAAAAPVLFLPTMYFTFSRAAWIALGVGIVAAVAVDPRRLQLVATLVAVAPASAIAVLAASHAPALSHGGRSAAAVHDGHRLAAVIFLLAIVNAAVGAALALAARRVRIGSRTERGFAVAVVVAVLLAAPIVLVHYGGPAHIARKAYDSFTAPLPPEHGDFNSRLSSFSGNGRSQLWGLAWDDARRHPILGAGAGTYERYFLAHQPADVSRVRDAHSLYIETLAEIGPIGLAVLLVFLLTPFAVIRRARRHPLIPAAVGAYVAYIVHTGVDWDWELPAVTLAGLICAIAILLAARSSTSSVPLAAWPRWAIAGCAVVAATFATTALLGNAALSRSASARERGDQAAAATDARRARFVMPWSPAPWRALGRAQLAAGFPLAARDSFRHAISMDSGDWELWYDLSRATKGPEQARALAHVAQLYPESGLVPTKTS
jgi:O-antigen ligase